MSHGFLDHPSTGSSPLSRGIRPSEHSIGLRRRIIPALAGNTVEDRLPRTAPADHPRSRGEYAGREAVDVTWTGSSPLSRGIPSPRAPLPRRRRIIPALAGNTTSHLSSTPTRTDHPRSRGEYAAARASSAHAMGSSPLSRGILLRQWFVTGRTGIIPALAGNTHL